MSQGSGDVGAAFGVDTPPPFAEQPRRLHVAFQRTFGRQLGPELPRRCTGAPMRHVDETANEAGGVEMLPR